MNGSVRQDAMPKEIDFRRIGVVLAGVVVLWLYLFVVILQEDACETFVVEDGQTTFTAQFDRLRWIVPANRDRTQEDLFDTYPVSMTVEIYSADGEQVAEATIQDIFIDTDGYIDRSVIEQNGLPADLTVGETYTIQYFCYVNGSPVESGLSFELCGDTVQLLGEAEALVILGLLLLFGWWLTEQERKARTQTDARPHRAAAGQARNEFGRVSADQSAPGAAAEETGGAAVVRNTRRAGFTARREELWTRFKESRAGYVVVFLSLAGLMLVSSPSLNESETERTAFADAYAFSNVLLGKERADDDGYVYIEESGIRNMGGLDDTQGLHRFWSDWESGNVRESGQVSSLYQTGGGIGGPLTWINGAAIAAARALRAPYQIVYLSGKIVNLLLGFAAYLIALWLLWGRSDALLHRGRFSLLVLVLFLLPSTLQGMLSYQGAGVFAALGMTAVLALLRVSRRTRPACLAALAVSAVVSVAGIVRILLSGGNVVTVFVRSIASQADDWVYGLSVLQPEIAEAFPTTALLLTGLVLVLWALVQLRLAGSRGRLNETGLAAVLAGCAAFVLSGSVEILESGRMILSGTSSAVLLPLLLIPVASRGKRSRRTENVRGGSPSGRETYDIADADGEALSDRPADPPSAEPPVEWKISPEQMDHLWEAALVLTALIGFRCVG